MKLRFSLRSMLVIITLFAIGTTIGYQKMKLKSAENEYIIAVNVWTMNLEGPSRIVEGSEKLMKVEAATIWISRREATRRHLERLTKMLRIAEHNVDYKPKVMEVSEGRLKKEVEVFRIAIERSTQEVQHP